MLPKSGDILADKYLLSETLGAGGFGVVFKATDQLLGRTVAIKIMRVTGGSHEDGLKRFFGEARNTSQLSHPHNVRVFDFGHAGDEMVYLVMEYVEGKQLSGMELPMHGPRLVKLLVQICRALSEAHALGLVHRDLKPDNVLVSQVDGADFARVLDYGIAKLEGSTGGLTGTGGFIGTPQYAAPEQLTGKPIDRRADVYALGAMAWALLVGRPLFVAEDPIGIAYMHVHQAPEPPSAHVAISQAFETALMRCLEKDADERFESMDALRQALLATPEAGAQAAPIGTMPVQASMATQLPPARGRAPLVASEPTIDANDLVAPSTSDTDFGEIVGASRSRGVWVAVVAIALLIGAFFALRGNGGSGDLNSTDALSDVPSEAPVVVEGAEPNADTANRDAEPTSNEVALDGSGDEDPDAALALGVDDAAAEPQAGAADAGDTAVSPSPEPEATPSDPRRAADRSAAEARAQAERERQAERAVEPRVERTAEPRVERAAEPRVEPTPREAPPADEPGAEPEARDRRSQLENLLGTPEPEPEPAPPSRRDRLDNTLNGSEGDQ